MVAAAAPIAGEVVVDYWPRGGARDLFRHREREVLIEGPAGTGKSRAALEKLHLCASKYAGMRGLIVRKTLVSLTASALVTFARQVLHPLDGVSFFGGSKDRPAAFLYPNGSVVVVGGMDKPSKIMSAEYDVALVNEATELTEADWEAITTRLRHGVMPYQQLVGDCNPDAPGHWLNQRAERGDVARVLSRHEDNPILWDAVTGRWTERGADYIAALDRLTGARKDRLRYGKWVAAEGQVYDAWDNAVHLIGRDHLPPESRLRYVAGVDWGWVKAGVISVFGVDGDGRMYLVAEHYQTRKPVDSWWIPRALALQQRYGVSEWRCDPSEPAYIAQFQNAGLNADKAINDILPGITAVQDRLVPAGDGRARLFVVCDCLVERDESLASDGQPWSTVQEIGSYVWAKDVRGVMLKDRPIDEYNHGLDALRYAVAGEDLRGDLIRPADEYVLSHFQGFPGLGDGEGY